jgi:hypothetical protein
VFSLDVELEAASEKLCNRFTTLGQDRLPMMEGKILVLETFGRSAYCLWLLMAAARTEALGQMRGMGGTDSTGGYSRRFMGGDSSSVLRNDSPGHLLLDSSFIISTALIV